MAGPSDSKKKSSYVAAFLSPDELAALDDWRFARRIGSRSEAIRQLIARGLAPHEGWQADRNSTAPRDDEPEQEATAPRRRRNASPSDA